MAKSFLLFIVFYFLVFFVALLGFFWQDSRFFWLSAINFVSLLFFFFVYSFFKKKESSVKNEVEKKEEKVFYPNQFVKKPYVKSKNNFSSFAGYFLFFSVFGFLFSVLDLMFFGFIGDFIWLFPFVYLFSLLLSGKNLIENKIKVFGKTFGFYFFLFLSSFVVGILVYGTLVFEALPILSLISFLVSFLFFFVGYLFIKNQGFRFFFSMIYSKLYFLLILFSLLWSIFVVPQKHTLKDVFDDLSFIFINKSQNTDPLLFSGQGEVLTSSIVDDFFQESGEVLPLSVNDVFISDDSLSGSNFTGNVIDTGENLKFDNIETIKEELGIESNQIISMIDALRFLMEYHKITLSLKTNTKFKYVSLSNPFYSYWKTAYENSMIGSSTNPSTKITCETYQVFKGMLLGRDLEYTSANVKKVFRDEAKKLDVLNGCEYGKLLKGENL